MGYQRGAYALGYVDDLRDPIEVVRPDLGTSGLGDLAASTRRRPGASTAPAAERGRPSTGRRGFDAQSARPPAPLARASLVPCTSRGESSRSFHIVSRSLPSPAGTKNAKKGRMDTRRVSGRRRRRPASGRVCLGSPRRVSLRLRTPRCSTCFSRTASSSRRQYGSLNRREGEAARNALLDVLRKNGAITPQRYCSWSRRRERPRRGPRTAEAPVPEKHANGTPAKSDEKHASIEPAKVDTKGHLEWSSADGNFTWRLGGRLHLDATFYDNRGGSEEKNGVDIRRARIELQGTLYKHWMWKLDYEFAQTEEVKQGFRDAYIRYLFKDYFPPKPDDAHAGAVQGVLRPRQPEQLQPRFRSSSGPCLRACSSTSRRVRRSPHRRRRPADRRERLLDRIGRCIREERGRRQRRRLADPLAIEGRTTISPIHTPTTAVHVGAAANWIDVFAPDAVQFRQRPEARIGAQRYLDTGVIQGAQDFTRWGLELGASTGRRGCRASSWGRT